MKTLLSYCFIVLGMGARLAFAQNASVTNAAPASGAEALAPKILRIVRIIEPENLGWTTETSLRVATWRGPITAKISDCRIRYELSNGSLDSTVARLIYLPSVRFYLFGDKGSMSKNPSNCFLFREGLLVFKAWEFSAYFVTNQIPEGVDPEAFIKQLKQDYLENYPSSWQSLDRLPTIVNRKLDQYFGEGRISRDAVTGLEKIIQAGAMGPGLPKILSIGTDGTNAVVAYDSLPELSDDRPVLTLDSQLQVVRAELNGKPLILNRTNNIYVRREEDRQRAEAEAKPK